jgi:hypothetical protein
MEFRRWCGGDERIREYCHDVVCKGAGIVARMWGTRVLGDEDQIGCMVNVEMPKTSNGEVFMRRFMVDVLLEKHHVALQVYKHNERWYARFSAQVFNEVVDFERVGKIVIAEMGIRSHL